MFVPRATTEKKQNTAKKLYPEHLFRLYRALHNDYVDRTNDLELIFTFSRFSLYLGSGGSPEEKQIKWFRVNNLIYWS